MWVVDFIFFKKSVQDLILNKKKMRAIPNVRSVSDGSTDTPSAD